MSDILELDDVILYTDEGGDGVKKEYICNNYDSKKSYKKGELVWYYGKQYISNRDHSAANWSEEDWSETNISEAFYAAHNLKVTSNEEFVYALTDKDDHFILGIRHDGSFVSKNAILSEVSSVYGNNLVKEDFAKSFRTISNNQYSMAIVDKNDFVVFGIKTNGQIVCKYLTDKIDNLDLNGYATETYVNNQVTAEENRATSVEENLQTQIDNIEPTVVVGGNNNPDEEYLTSIDDKLTVKNFSKSIYNRNKVFVRDITTDLDLSDTVYIINKEFNLNNNTITIPSNSVLVFENGLVKNGTLSGNNTNIVSLGACFYNMNFTGTWNIDYISTNMFADKNSVNCLKKINSLLDDNYKNEVYVAPGDYTFTPNVSSDSLIVLKSNTKLIIDGTITVTANGFHHYYVVNSANKTNIEITGKGEIVGDADTHDYVTIQSTHEWCHAIHTTNTHNVVIHDLKLSNMPGDGIEIDGNNYKIYNMTISHCGRQGISVLSCVNVDIDNCNIADIYRVAPMAAIDVEPYTSNYARNIKISNIKCDKCYGIMVLYADVVKVENLTATNCYKVLEGTDARNVIFSNIDYSDDENFQPILIVNFTNSKNIFIEKSKFKPSVQSNFSLSNITTLFGNEYSNITFTNIPEEGSIKYENHKYSFYNGTQWSEM